MSVFPTTRAARLALGLGLCWLLLAAGPAAAVPPSAAGDGGRGVDSALLAYEDGYRLYRAGDLWNAERRLQEALQLEPNLLKAHYWLGKVYRELGMLKESVFHWEEVLRLQALIRQRRLALSLQNNEYPAASQIVATRDRQRQAEEAFRKGRGLLEQGHWDGALVELKNAVALYPGHPDYLKLLARALWDQADLQASGRFYSDLLDLPRLPRDVGLEAVDRLTMIGSRQAARRGLQRLLETWPGDPELTARLNALEQTAPAAPVSAGRVVRVLRGQAVVNVGLEDGLKLADEYRLRFRAFRSGDEVTDPATGRLIGRTPDRICGDLLVTKVLSRSSWVLIQREFGGGVKEGDLVEVQAGLR